MEVHMDANVMRSQLRYRPIFGCFVYFCLICLCDLLFRPGPCYVALALSTALQAHMTDMFTTKLALQSRAKKPDRQAMIYRRHNKAVMSRTVEQSPNYYSMVLDNCKRYFFEISKSHIDNPGKMMYDNKVSAFPARTSRRPGARPH